MNGKNILIIFFLISAATILFAQLGLFSGIAPSDLGVTNGRLKPPSKNENSVSSQAEFFYQTDANVAYAKIAPLNYKGNGRSAITKLKQLILSDFREGRLVEEKESYLRYEFKTKLMNFTDDVEFSLNENENHIDFRSASRLGRKDFGKNRARLETIRNKFADLNR